MNRLLLFFPLLFVQGLEAQPMSWITECSNKSFCLNQNSCTQGAVYLVEKAVTNCGSPNINYSYKIDLNNDNTVDIQSSNDTVSAPFSKGIHKIIWRATDNCGSIIQCTYLFEVKDCQPPNLLCINGLTKSLASPGCLESFLPSQFILSMSDNCTPNPQLKLGIRKAGEGTGFPDSTTVSFGNCEKGFNPIEVWVKDGNGLTNNCNNYVIIQDGVNSCSCNPDGDLYFNGCARTGANKRLSSFKLKTQFNTLPGASSPISQNITQIVEDSCYSLHIDKLPFGNNYQAIIRGERYSQSVLGVTTYDLVLTSKHILAIEPFTSVYQMAAADVNKSSSVTTFDILETRKLILGIYDTFPLVPAWRIVRAIANPSNVANFTALVDTIQITSPNLLDDQTFQNLDFVGIKYGDVNGSASFDGEPGAEDRYNAPPLLLRSDNPWLETGEETTLRFFPGEAGTLEGWQLALEADPSRLQILEANGLPADQFSLRGPEFRALWADGAGQFFDSKKAIFQLKIKALQPTQVSDALFLNSEKLRPEAYTPAENHATNRRPLYLHFGSSASSSTTFFPAHPNPFTQETSFGLLLENSGDAQLDVFDLNGRRVFSETYEMGPGFQTLQFPASALPGKGVFVYRLSVGEAVSRGRLVRI